MSQATLQTSDGARISKRLANHWQHKFTISEEEHGYIIHMPNADVVLNHDADNLYIQLNSKTSDLDETKLQEVVAAHIDRMAGQSFDYQWIV